MKFVDFYGRRIFLRDVREEETFRHGLNLRCYRAALRAGQMLLSSSRSVFIPVYNPTQLDGAVPHRNIVAGESYRDARDELTFKLCPRINVHRGAAEE